MQALLRPVPSSLMRTQGIPCMLLFHPLLQANPLVRAALEEQGAGRVLVVDGGASMR